MLRKFAEADYGAEAKGHLEALEQIARTGIVPQPLRWVPGEVLELTRWSEPDQPGARTRGATGREGHMMRAFACAVLLVAGGQTEGRAPPDGENQTVIQLIASVLELGGELAPATANLLFGRLARRSTDADEAVFFILGLLILLRLGGQHAPTPAQWTVLATWLDDAETDARLASAWPDSGYWLIDLSAFDVQRPLWKRLARRAFEEAPPPGVELISERMSAWEP